LHRRISLAHLLLSRTQVEASDAALAAATEATLVAAAQRVQVAQEAAASANLEATLAQAVAAARQEAVGALSRQVRQLEVELTRASSAQESSNLVQVRFCRYRFLLPAS
jgi:hypothetical protein